MTNPFKNLHLDDVLFFSEVSEAMKQIAKQYHLPLRSINPASMPAEGMADFLGLCSATGDIHLVMRATVDGQFVDRPRSPEDVWRTAAHELSHLKYMNHGNSFMEFFAELQRAMDNLRKPDHRTKIIDKLVKMQQSRDGEAAIGNSAAAEAFAAAINRMLIEHELNPSDLDYARVTDNDSVIEMKVASLKYGIKGKKTRVAWQESLARIVARAHLCKFLLRPGSNDIWFVGTKAHAVVAEYVYGTLVPAADRMSYLETRKYSEELKKQTGSWAGVNGFREAWIDAFIHRVDERFDESRKAAVKEVVQDLPPGSESQALIRLSGALVKAEQYIDDKFSSRRGRKTVHALHTGYSRNAEGRARGRAAADSLPIGRRGVTGGSQKLLK